MVDESGQRLGTLGVSADEERLYLLLLSLGPTNLSELARAAQSSPARVRALVTSLEGRGLVSRSAHRRPLLVAVQPESALENLLSQRWRELESARGAISELLHEFRELGPSTHPTEVVEIISGRDAIVETVSRLQIQTNEEVLIFDKPPYQAGGGQNVTELDLLARGIRYRVIYDRSALEHPGQLELLREITEAGEEARFVEALPTSLAIFDKSVAFISLQAPSDRQSAQRIVIRASPLLTCLMALFDLFWMRAQPLTFSGTELLGDNADAYVVNLSEQDRKLLLLLAADLKDDAIGRQLGIARRSVQRRIRALMDKTGVSTRLQLVLHAARNGWV